MIQSLWMALSLAPSLLPSMSVCLVSAVSLQLLLLCLRNLLLFQLLAWTLLLLMTRTPHWILPYL